MLDFFNFSQSVARFSCGSQIEKSDGDQNEIKKPNNHRAMTQ